MDAVGFTPKPYEDQNGRPVYGPNGEVIPVNGIVDDSEDEE